MRRSQGKAADNHRFFAVRVAVELLHMEFHYFRRSLASECNFPRRRRSEMAHSVHKTLQLQFTISVCSCSSERESGKSTSGATVGGGRCEHKNPEKAKA